MRGWGCWLMGDDRRCYRTRLHHCAMRWGVDIFTISADQPGGALLVLDKIVYQMLCCLTLCSISYARQQTIHFNVRTSTFIKTKSVSTSSKPSFLFTHFSTSFRGRTPTFLGQQLSIILLPAVGSTLNNLRPLAAVLVVNYSLYIYTALLGECLCLHDESSQMCFAVSHTRNRCRLL